MAWSDAVAVGEHLGKSVSTVMRMTRAAEIPAVKVGHTWRYDLDEIDKFLRGQREDPWAQSIHSRAQRRAS